ncbi:putative E3 ubiquitin-protein ligase HERC1 [Symbiodinium microadriaticum]|uniref:Putative E3 ubiquitin-protein ligase HERC1 n=1 Tax=Symbiodinium microadriaticum TaxID=2951 RepID=A0A1Q9ENM9_SYMMI|nr:putative E3 ubiquitin-protein ligase HERC1 [Symbiodinium microadriaticum]
MWINVALLSGRTASLHVESEVCCVLNLLYEKALVQDLRREAERELGCRLKAVVSSGGEAISEATTLAAAGVADGETLYGLVHDAGGPLCNRWSRVLVVVTDEGNLRTWWGTHWGRNHGRGYQPPLQDVRQVASTSRAVAVVHADGRVTSFGSRDHGSSCKKVEERLVHVEKIVATSGAFAAICRDGSVVTWGRPQCGANSTSVRFQLREIVEVCGTANAFAARRADGAVVSWGFAGYGGNIPPEVMEVRDAQELCATAHTFALRRADGTVVTWGRGLDISHVQDQLQNVQSLCGTSSAFAALRADGTVVSWGDSRMGGCSASVQDQLWGIQQLTATSRAFAALRSDSQVVCWGDPACGGDASSMESELVGIMSVTGSGAAFAALRSDGRVVTWGDAESGGASEGVTEQLRDVRKLAASRSAFAAIRGDGMDRLSHGATLLNRGKKTCEGGAAGGRMAYMVPEPSWMDQRAEAKEDEEPPLLLDGAPGVEPVQVDAVVRENVVDNGWSLRFSQVFLKALSQEEQGPFTQDFLAKLIVILHWWADVDLSSPLAVVPEDGFQEALDKASAGLTADWVRSCGLEVRLVLDRGTAHDCPSQIMRSEEGLFVNHPNSPSWLSNMPQHTKAYQTQALDFLLFSIVPPQPQNTFGALLTFRVAGQLAILMALVESSQQMVSKRLPFSWTGSRVLRSAWVEGHVLFLIHRAALLGPPQVSLLKPHLLENVKPLLEVFEEETQKDDVMHCIT